VIDAVVKIVDEMKNFLKPKPNTPHYTFSSREVWNIINSLSLSNKNDIKDELSLCKLWVHETCRVIRDKLVFADIETFDKLLEDNLRNSFSKELHTLRTNGML
jgi:dynein heavy chain